MQFNRLILTAALAAVAGCAYADYMQIKTSTGWEVLDLDAVDRLTFAGGVMNAVDANQKTVLSVPQENLEKMYVSEDAAAVGGLLADAETHNFEYDAEACALRMLAGGTVSVYSADGSKLVEIPSVEKGEVVSFAGMAPGVVIVKSGKQTLKALIK